MSDANSWSDAPVQPPKKKMNGCLLAALIVGGLGSLGLMICCGAAFWFGSMFIPKIMNVPAEVLAVAKSIVDMKYPDNFQPTTANTIDNPFFMTRFARLAHQEGKGILILRSLKVKMGDANQANLQLAPLRAQDELEINGNMTLKKTESQEVTIAGQKVSVLIGEGTDMTGKPIHTVKGEVTTIGGSTYFLLRVDDDIWDQEAILKMLEEAKIP